MREPVAAEQQREAAPDAVLRPRPRGGAAAAAGGRPMPGRGSDRRRVEAGGGCCCGPLGGCCCAPLGGCCCAPLGGCCCGPLGGCCCAPLRAPRSASTTRTWPCAAPCPLHHRSARAAIPARSLRTRVRSRAGASAGSWEGRVVPRAPAEPTRRAAPSQQVTARGGAGPAETRHDSDTRTVTAARHGPARRSRRGQWRGRGGHGGRRANDWATGGGCGCGRGSRRGRP
jgi:hypothetical protein